MFHPDHYKNIMEMIDKHIKLEKKLVMYLVDNTGEDLELNNRIDMKLLADMFKERMNNLKALKQDFKHYQSLRNNHCF